MKRSEFITDFCNRINAPVATGQRLVEGSGRLIGVGHLANLRSKGLGCRAIVRLGRKVGYETKAFGEWLADIMGLED